MEKIWSEVDYLEKKLGEFGEKLFQKVDKRTNDRDKFVKEGKVSKQVYQASLKTVKKG